MTRKVKFLQPAEFYDDFIKNFKFGCNQELRNYVTMYVGRKISTVTFFEDDAVLLEEMYRSLTLTAWIAEHYKNWYGNWMEDTVRTSKELMAVIMDENINYVEGFSEAYESIGSLLCLYKNLTYGIENDLPVLRTIITEDHINLCLKDLGEKARVKDIEEDIIEHGILAKRGDHYEWIDPIIGKLLYDADISLLYAFNTEKLLRKIRYVS